MRSVVTDSPLEDAMITFESYFNETEDVLVKRIVDFDPIVIVFEDPVIVSARPLELNMIERPNWDEEFPDGHYGYSLTRNVSIRFPKERLVLQSVFVKKHRSSQFFEKVSHGTFEILGLRHGKVVLRQKVILSSDAWCQLIPAVSGVTLDQLILPAGLDFDNLHVSLAPELPILSQVKKRSTQP